MNQQNLQRLLDAQHSAVASSDNAAVIESTRKLAAEALQQIANLRLLQGQNTQAVDLYRQALKVEGSDAAHVDLAVALFRARKNEDAMAEVERVLGANPGTARAWQLKGSLQMADEDYRGATVSLARSLDLQPDVNAQYALGFSLLKIHDVPKAAAIFRQMLESYGDKAIWHIVFGGAYRDAEYPDEAIVEFKKAVAMDPKVGHGHFFLGLTYLQENHWAPNPDSLANFQQAIRLEPKNYLVNFYLGALESTAKQFASSDAHLHVAAEVEPNSPETWLYLGLNAYQQQKTAEAKTYLHKAIDTTGGDEARNNYQIRRAYFVLGRIAVSEGQHEEAEKLLARVKEFQQKTLANSAGTISTTMQQEGLGAAPGVAPVLPKAAAHDSVDSARIASESGTTEVGSTLTPPPLNDVETRQIEAREKQLREILANSFNDLGTAAARQHQYADALTDFHEAEQWDASTPGLLRNVGVAAFRQNDFAESARALQGVVASNPSDQRSRLMLAMSLFSLERFAEAAAQFTPIPDATAADPRAAYAWAYSLARTGQQQQANRIADQLVEQTLPADVLSLVCHLYTDVENYEHSVSCFRKAYQQNEGLKRAHYEVGSALIHLGRPREAITELEQELTQSPGEPDVQYYLAYALLQSSRKQEAAKLLQTVIDEQPNHAQAQYELGKLLLADGKTEDAIQHLEIAEKNDASTDYIHYQLQIAYRKQGRLQDAEREVKIYRDLKAHLREVDPAHAIEK